MAANPLHDQITEIEENIATYKAEIKKARHNQRLYFLGIVGILAGAAIFLFISLKYVNFSDLNSHDQNKTFIPVTALSIGAMGGLFGLAWLIVLVNLIITEQNSITSYNAEIDIWEAKKRVTAQFASINEKPSYFDSLVRINVENLAAYYGLVKIHTDNSYRVAIRVCIFGFFLIIVGLTIGFIDFTNAHIVSYIASGSGIVTEFISSIFFYLYNRTVRQMKEYHDSLLAVQNILLSFKLVEDTHDEGEKAKIISQMLAYLINKQGPSTLVSSLSTSAGQNIPNDVRQQPASTSP